MDPSEFVPPRQIGLDVDHDRINRPDIQLSHQQTPKVRLTVGAPLRTSNSLTRIQLSFPFRQKRSHRFWNCLGVDVSGGPSSIVATL